MPDPSPSTPTVLNSNFLQLRRRSGGRPQRTVYPRRLPVNTVIHTTLAGLEPTTLRLLVRRATSSATDSPLLMSLTCSYHEVRVPCVCMYGKATVVTWRLDMSITGLECCTCWVQSVNRSSIFYHTLTHFMVVIGYELTERGRGGCGGDGIWGIEPLQIWQPLLIWYPTRGLAYPLFAIMPMILKSTSKNPTT